MTHAAKYEDIPGIMLLSIYQNPEPKFPFLTLITFNVRNNFEYKFSGE